MSTWKKALLSITTATLGLACLVLAGFVVSVVLEVLLMWPGLAHMAWPYCTLIVAAFAGRRTLDVIYTELIWKAEHRQD